MPGHLHHRLTRWLRLGLTSLALALGAVPAYALPAAQPVVTLSIEQRQSAKQGPLHEAPVHARSEAGQASVPLASRVCPVAAGSVPATRPPGPPRRLFITHRALLR
jgi:hypothetical protein